MPNELEEIRKELEAIKELALKKSHLSKFKKYMYRQSPEYILTLAIFVAMFGLMALACVFRLCGIGWFSVDCSKVVPPEIWLQEVIKFTLFWFEGIFITKILCDINWGKAFLMSFGFSCLTFIMGLFIPKEITATVQFVYMVIISVLLNPHSNLMEIKKSLLKLLVLSILIILYGCTMLFGRYEFTILSNTNYVYNILSLIDYKLLFVNIYLFLRLKEKGA